MSEIEQRLAEIEQRGLGRRLRTISGPQGPRVLLDGREVLLLCSNNYLGLAHHPRVREAASEAARRWGVGTGASRLVSGTMEVHRELEERLAAFEGSEACVLFGSGYLANLGAIGALAGPGDTIFSDALNHASIVDGCRCARAHVQVYRHRDSEHLEWCLRHAGKTPPGGGAGETRHGGSADKTPPGGSAGKTPRGGGAGRTPRVDGAADGRRLIVTDSVFSMDGDVAPLEEIVALARRWGARVLVDEAHATGALGPGGRGAVAEAGLEGEVDVLVGTLGKALGSYGAYVCAGAEMVRYLINSARALIFSTAPSPPAVAGAGAALELLVREPGRVRTLRARARALRGALAAEGWGVEESEMHIVPLLVGGEREAVALCEAALERGVYAQAIRAPSVPRGAARLRLTAMATHSEQELRHAAGVLSEAARAVGIEPGTLGGAAGGGPLSRAA